MNIFLALCILDQLNNRSVCSLKFSFFHLFLLAGLEVLKELSKDKNKCPKNYMDKAPYF